MLARYLESGHDANLPDRVEWIEARDLPTNDPYTASLIMRATAAQSVRVEKPVYHIALSFDPDDGADRAMLVRVADRLLDDLGLREHQALIVAHGDTRCTSWSIACTWKRFALGTPRAITRESSARCANRSVSWRCAPFPANCLSMRSREQRCGRTW